ncbi:DNA-binding protein [Rhizobium johnstonii]|uniref:DNA-binding protein n=1 Tax=Rhizobium leguminosarum TaxID=384 RepID=UPI0010307E39|nr:DNA-binding protein [Rhizobium leguminosarum]TBG20636.1 DNA-binding protein [Rhizobium leguminosarum]TBG46552.1 DNA-binding protein [Rhizobium leguminosarum]TBG79523.1 DNA-binding protein [Rhizobium leguminosarum]WSG97238.1 DNA-binding protein [Rhizobium johnstonii]
MENNGTESEDLVWGISAIARVIGRTDRQTYHMLDTGALPAKRVGGRWVASRKKLLSFLVDDAA